MGEDERIASVLTELKQALYWKDVYKLELDQLSKKVDELSAENWLLRESAAAAESRLRDYEQRYGELGREGA